MTWPVSQERTDMVGQTVVSPVWGNAGYPVTQDFGVLGFRPDWYQYSAAHGFPPGYHIGLDVGTPKLTPVYANAYATVEHAGPSDSFRPNPVILTTSDDPRTGDNESGFTETYGHLWEDAVTTGQSVKPGDLIGYTGEQTLLGTMTPDGSGPHIHFEVYDPKGNAINPLPFLSIPFTPGSGDNSGTGDATGSGSGVPLSNPLTDVPGLGSIGDAITHLGETLSTVAFRGLIAAIGLALLAGGLYALTQSGGVKGSVRLATKAGTTAAKVL